MANTVHTHSLSLSVASVRKELCFDNLFDVLVRNTKDFSKPVGFNAHVEHPFLSFSTSLDVKSLSNRLHSKPMHHRTNTIPFQWNECVRALPYCLLFLFVLE